MEWISLTPGSNLGSLENSLRQRLRALDVFFEKSGARFVGVRGKKKRRLEAVEMRVCGDASVCRCECAVLSSGLLHIRVSGDPASHWASRGPGLPNCFA